MGVVLHRTSPISLEIGPYRNRQKRASETMKSQHSDCAAQPEASDDLAEGASRKFDGNTDTIWREVMAMDVQAILDTGIHRLRQAGALRPEACDTSSHPDGVTHLFLPKFGGLRLAARAA